MPLYEHVRNKNETGLETRSEVMNSVCWYVCNQYNFMKIKGKICSSVVRSAKKMKKRCVAHIRLQLFGDSEKNEAMNTL
jgi:hypothetical protein